ncbi:barstar family protein, partial [Streptomyces anthocyanicus]|uniref:barstar family protein n=1 Tax=Streptomyces TaxID=1883 RepID=UPI003658D4A3
QLRQEAIADGAPTSDLAATSTGNGHQLTNRPLRSCLFGALTPWKWTDYSVVMAKRIESELVVDLQGRPIETLDDFWDAVAEPCGLPEWFGRNTEAWRDTIQTRGISEVVDNYDVLVVHVDKRGVFAARDREARALRSAFSGKQSRLVVHELL